MSAGALVTPPTHTQMKEVNSTLYGWSWGELEFEWTTVGPFKDVRAAVTRTLLLTQVLCESCVSGNPTL